MAGKSNKENPVCLVERERKREKISSYVKKRAKSNKCYKETKMIIQIPL